MEGHQRTTNHQFLEMIPEFLGQVKTNTGTRDSQIVALGQACEALISNQNSLLENRMGIQATATHRLPPRKRLR